MNERNVDIYVKVNKLSVNLVTCRKPPFTLLLKNIECSLVKRESCMLCDDVKGFNEQYKLQGHANGVFTTITRRMERKRTRNGRAGRLSSLKEIMQNPTC